MKLTIQTVGEQFLSQLRKEIQKNKDNMNFDVPRYADVADFGITRSIYSATMKQLLDEELVISKGKRYALPGRIITENVFVVQNIPVPIIFADHADAQDYAKRFTGARIETMAMAK